MEVKVFKSQVLNSKSETNLKFEFLKAQNGKFTRLAYLKFDNLDLSSLLMVYKTLLVPENKSDWTNGVIIVSKSNKCR